MKANVWKRAALLLMVSGSLATATTYTWVGPPPPPPPQPPPAWNDPDNWDCVPSCPPTAYPSTTNDDAIIQLSRTILITADETIDDLSIATGGGSNGGARFRGNATSATTITCDTVTISGANSAQTIVTAMRLARVKTN